MSERNDDDKYARYWEPVLVFFLVAALIVITYRLQLSEVRDLQRRVGQLESERR